MIEISIKYTSPNGTPYIISYTTAERLRFRDLMDEAGQRINLHDCHLVSVKQSSSERATQ